MGYGSLKELKHIVASVVVIMPREEVVDTKGDKRVP